jgi:hypothetical protein
MVLACRSRRPEDNATSADRRELLLSASRDGHSPRPRRAAQWNEADQERQALARARISTGTSSATELPHEDEPRCHSLLRSPLERPNEPSETRKAPEPALERHWPLSVTIFGV